ncbi:MAG TPA: MFS transporter, partial [Gemmatimonadales bacterium]|nr:MFS transporter [Gemmatimonadales bacterium]
MASEVRGWYRWYALGLLALLNVLSYLDRNVIFGLFEPIKNELHLTDTQLGWLGSAYVLLFSLTAFPFGLLSDLRSRRAVVAAGVAVWSTFTSLGGLVRGFGQLFATRAAVGVGGAAFGPASNSLVADYFPGHRRALAFGILMAGVPVGGALGFWLGGQLQEMYGWRVAFFAVGVPGLFLAALAARLVDPTRAPEPVHLKRVLARFEIRASALLRQFAPLL